MSVSGSCVTLYCEYASKKKKKILLAKIWVEMVLTHMNNNLVLHRRGNETLNLFQKAQRNTGNAPQLFYTM